MENIFEIKQGELFSANAKEIVSAVVKILDSKKAGDIKVLKIDNKTIIADYFVICSGKSMAQVKAIFEGLEEKMEDNGVECRHKDGFKECKWIALDYGNVIVHIFHNTTREFYQLDKLWNNGNNITDYIEE